MTKKLPDLSQIYEIKFYHFVPIDSIMMALKKLSEVSYVDQPIQAVILTEPDDFCYNNEGNCISGLTGNQWNQFKINASKAWDITKGASTIKIADIGLATFDGRGVPRTHPDFINSDGSSQFIGGDISSLPPSLHQTEVCGVIGAATDNGIGIASLGWNIKIIPYFANEALDEQTNIPTKIYQAISDGAKVINCSFTTIKFNSKIGGCTIYESHSYQSIENVINTAIYGRNRVVVASTGNRGFELTNGGCSESQYASLIPYAPYPADYNDVIGVSATDIEDIFAGGLHYNFDDAEGIGDEKFIDIAAPGINILTTATSESGSNYRVESGTSLSSPLVAALAGLIFSINSSLTPQEVRNILINTAEKVDAQNHPYCDGRNDYEGYGRINAYEALKYTLEHYGGTLSQNLTIPSGETWSFDPGVSLTFENGTSLIVYGTLSAQGTTTNNITFDFIASNSSTQNGIKINSGGSVNISNALIKNAYRGIYVNEAVGTIDNCEIKNCFSSGVYLYRTNYASGQPIIINCLVHDNGSGIVNYYSSPHIRNNEVYNNYTGIGLADYSSAYLGEAGYYGNNNIYNNNKGIYALRNSNPFLGRETCTIQAGHNKIYGNSFAEIQAENNCTILAELNWWGSNPPDANKIRALSGSTIDYTPYLTSSLSKVIVDRNQSPEELAFNNEFVSYEINSGSSATDSIAGSGFDPSWQIFWKLLYARNLIDVEKYDFAEKICKDIIDEFPDSSLSFYALDLLWKASQVKDKSFFVNYLSSIKSKNLVKDLYGSAELILAGYDINSRLSSIDQTANNYGKSYIAEAALFSKFLYYFNDKNNIEMARAVSKEIDELFPNSPASIDAHQHLGDNINNFNVAKQGDAEEILAVKNLPERYELLGNFPNPFNPNTNISYALPYQSLIELVIYDIMGRVIKSFSLSKSAGYQSIKWNGTNDYGSNVSSGIYFYVLKAKSLSTNDVFQHSGKLIMLK